VEATQSAVVALLKQFAGLSEYDFTVVGAGDLRASLERK